MKKIRYLLSFTAVFLLLAAAVFWNIFTGTAGFDLNAADSLLWQKVIFNIRLPRICAAVLLGGALSVSGFLLQTFFANPIAGPYVLGISSGARLFVAALMIFFVKLGISMSSWGLAAAAFAGSLAALFLVLALSMKVRSMSVLVICGIMIGYICSAVTDFLVTFASDSSIVNLHNWSLGSFSGTTWNDVTVIAVIVLFSLCACMLQSKKIGALQLGETYAASAGVNIKQLRIVLILLSSLLSAAVTAFAGPVSFVGIAVPHLIKSLFGTARPLVMIPACFWGGALITVFCDGIARTLFAPVELAIGSVTSVLLVPVVIFMLVKGRK